MVLHLHVEVVTRVLERWESCPRNSSHKFEYDWWIFNICNKSVVPAETCTSVASYAACGRWQVPSGGKRGWKIAMLIFQF